MKIFFTILTITILLTGCATRNAFSKLGMTVEQELALENTKSGKMQSEEIVGGVYSSIYMNNVSSKIDKKYITFYVSVYLKNQSKNLKITMNTQNPLEIKELALDNEYAHLLSKTSEWSKNYLVSFENNASSEVNLLIESGQFSSGQLNYLKDLR